MEFDDPAADALESLYNDGPPFLVDRVEQALDSLQRDPGQAALRRQRFTRPPVWGFPVRIQNYDWMILWWLDEDEVVITYIGPDSFRPS